MRGRIIAFATKRSPHNKVEEESITTMKATNYDKITLFVTQEG